MPTLDLSRWRRYLVVECHVVAMGLDKVALQCMHAKRLDWNARKAMILFLRFPRPASGVCDYSEVAKQSRAEPLDAGGGHYQGR